jgi:GNAT superfamily N-acetyltransferase
MSEITFRPYQNSDWPQVLNMLIQTMEFHMSIQSPVRFERYTKELLINYLLGITGRYRSGRGQLIVAEISTGVLAGFVYGEVDKQDKELAACSVPTGTVEELFVLAEMRGQNVGQELMKRIETFLINRGCTLIKLNDVHFYNKTARHLYEKLGYEPRVIQYGKRVG